MPRADGAVLADRWPMPRMPRPPAPSPCATCRGQGQRGKPALAAAFARRPREARPWSRRRPSDRRAGQAAWPPRWRCTRSQPDRGRAHRRLGVGGYGRAEMAPQSDVDLLFLTPWKITPWAESVIETMLYMLWDLKLKVGHSSRTVKDCLRLGREDITIRTALLEHRFICGHAPLAPNWPTGSGASCSATPARNSSRRSWPNGPSGTSGRAASAMCWSRTSKRARAACATCRRCTGSASTCTGSPRAEGLVGAGLLSREEFDSFARAEDFLWAVRCHLHYITGRATDTLTFDLQVEVAARMGYRDSGGRRAVEHLHAGLLPPRHPGGRTDPHLPDRAGGPPRQARASLFGIFKLTKRVKPSRLQAGAGPDRRGDPKSS
jgi:[protein-PII] uridylyltransferase